MEKTKKLNVQLPIGIKFITIVLLTFAIFAAITSVIQNYFTITIENNLAFLRKWMGVYSAIQISILVAFFKRQISEYKLNTRSLTLLCLFLMLATTILDMKWSIYITVAFGIISILYGLFVKKHFKPHPLFCFIIGYFIFQVIGLTWSIEPHYGFKILERELSYLLVPVAFSFFVITNQERHFLFKLFFRLLLIYMLSIIVAYIFQINFHGMHYLDGFGFNKHYFTPLIPGFPENYKLILTWTGYTHPTFICFILNLMLGIGIYLSKNDKSPDKLSKTELILFGVLTLTSIFILQSRIAMISFPVVGILVLYNFFYKKRLLTIILTLFIFVIAVLIFIFVLLPHKNFFDDPVRLDQFRVMINFIREHYLWGTGTGGMIKYIPIFPTANNQIIGDLFHLGIGGLLMLIFLCGAILYYSIKDRNYMLFLFFVLYFLIMQTEMPLQLQKGITFFTLFIGLFVRPSFKTE